MITIKGAGNPEDKDFAQIVQIQDWIVHSFELVVQVLKLNIWVY